MIRIREISMHPEHNVAQLSYEAAQLLKISASKVRKLKIVRRSVDARKKPDIRYKNLTEMAKLPELQKQILYNVADYVRPGGVLLYSTCTLVREENEAVVESFLQQHPDYELEPLPLPAAFPKNEAGMLALVPGQYDTDGFFIARLRRKSCT